jgi:uncharacterized coiled-coil protein SlyX
MQNGCMTSSPNYDSDAKKQADFIYELASRLKDDERVLDRLKDKNNRLHEDLYRTGKENLDLQIKCDAQEKTIEAQAFTLSQLRIQLEQDEATVKNMDTREKYLDGELNKSAEIMKAFTKEKIKLLRKIKRLEKDLSDWKKLYNDRIRKARA